MWKQLEALQKDLYGQDSMVLLFAYKNIGVCYLALGNSVDSKFFFNKCIKLLEDVMKDTDSEEQRKKDKIELSSIYQNLYLTTIY